jgi:hypothetical protein
VCGRSTWVSSAPPFLTLTPGKPIYCLIKVWRGPNMNNLYCIKSFFERGVCILVYKHCCPLGGNRRFSDVLYKIVHSLSSSHHSLYSMNYILGRLNCTVAETSARIHRPSFRENEPKTLVFYYWKRSFWACFRENWVYKFSRKRAQNARFLLLKTIVLFSRKLGLRAQAKYRAISHSLTVFLRLFRDCLDFVKGTAEQNWQVNRE